MQQQVVPRIDDGVARSFLSRPGALSALLAGLIAAAFLAVMAAAFTSPLGYDESYNLQVPIHLAEDHHYATDGTLYDASGRRDFDALISTGPTVLAPIGVAYAVIGEHVWVARALMCAWFVGLAAGLHRLGVVLGGARAGAAALLGLLAVNLRAEWPSGSGWPNWHPLGPGDVLGELPATALLVWSALALGGRRWRTAGLLLGLAILTKVVMAVALPAFMVAVLLDSRRRLSEVIHRVVRVAGCVALPLLGWQALRLVALGRSEYAVRVEEFMLSMFARGSGLVASRNGSFGPRILILADAAYLAPVAAVLLVAAALLLVPRYRPHPGPSNPARHGSTTTTMRALLGSAFSLALWWLLVADQPYFRHVLPAVLVLLPILAAWLVTAADRTPGRRVLGNLVIGALAAMSATHAVAAFRLPELLSDQRAVVRYLEEHAPGQLRHLGWWNAPELRALGGQRPLPLSDSPGVLVISPQQRNHDSPIRLRLTRSACTSPPVRVHGYAICEASATRLQP